MKVARIPKRAGPVVITIVVGAGTGRRFDSHRPKAFAALSSGETLLHLTLRRLAASPLVTYQIAVVPVGYEKKVAHWPDRAALRLVLAVPGGRHRSQSVFLGLRAAERFLSGTDAIVLIHDAARPLVSPALVERVVKGVLKHGNATPAVHVPDTIKQAEHETFTSTLDRSCLYAVQTPQGFRLSQHLRILKLHPGAHLDDTIPWSIEKKDVFRVEGERWNIKVTYPDDLRIVEALLPLVDDPEGAVPFKRLSPKNLEPIPVGAASARGRARATRARRPKQATQRRELTMQADAANRRS